jgi:hypothetical protein
MPWTEMAADGICPSPSFLDNQSHPGGTAMSTTQTQPATTLLHINTTLVEEFKSIFVNRLAYMVQNHWPDKKTGRFNYHKAADSQKNPIKLDDRMIAAHLMGKETIGFYAIAPKVNTCKWIAIDADYDNAIADLTKLKQAFAGDGLEALTECSRRGAHLWLFLAEPLPAAMCRLYILFRANQLGVTIKVKDTDEGIEVFPRQDVIVDGKYGNAIRAPFGVHRATMQRYWFEGAEENLEAQLALVRSVKRVERADLERLTAEMKLPEIEQVPKPKPFVHTPAQRLYEQREEFDMIELLRKNGVPLKAGRTNCKAPCPVCDGDERRPYKWHMSISTKEPTKYQCFRGCTAEDIRAMLGNPKRPYNGPNRF